MRELKLSSDDRDALHGLARGYGALFDGMVAINEEIGAQSHVYLQAVHRVEPMLDNLHAQAERGALATHARLDEDTPHRRPNRAARQPRGDAGGAGRVGGHHAQPELLGQRHQALCRAHRRRQSGHADAALYRAKGNGRDRVVLARD